MTDYEPPYAEPAEPPARARIEGARPWLVVAIGLILIGHLAAAVISQQAEQDPSLEMPLDQIPVEEPADP